jgi:hypothetical protein
MTYGRTLDLPWFNKGTSATNPKAESRSITTARSTLATPAASTIRHQPHGYLEEEELYYDSSDTENGIEEDNITAEDKNTETITGKEQDKITSNNHATASTTTTTTRRTTSLWEKHTPIMKIKETKMQITMGNLPFGHVCDDTAIGNDTPYVRLYCQNVNGIFDREGIGLDSAFKEIKQAGADIFTFNETHGDESNAIARRALRL